MQKRKQEEGFKPQFEWTFLKPQYWGVWLGFLLLVLFAFLPIRLRDTLLARIGRFAGRRVKSARQRAEANLAYCFQHKSAQERERILDHMFEVVLPVTGLLVELAIRKRTRAEIIWQGFEHLEQAKAKQQNVIFLVPHAWAIDIPAMLLAKEGFTMAAMFHNQNNRLIDWMWNRARKQFGGRLHARDEGIKPFIQSIRQGYWGFYLPDEDHGIEHSVFVDFFDTYKATLPVLGRMQKLCRAEVIPLFPAYDPKHSRLTIVVHPPMQDLSQLDDSEIARSMNQEVEKFVTRYPEQYAWVLRLLKTRKPGEKSPYSS